MESYDFETWDVFTRDKFAGNQLAVLMDARGLTTEQMQAITREFNLSETTFVLPPEGSSNTARVRIFTLGYEMPFAGHPTVGTAIAIARARGLTGEIKLELNAGLFPVTLDMSGDVPYAAFRNPNLPRQTSGAPSASAIEEALSLPSGAVDRGEHQPRLMGAGADFVYARAPLEIVRAAKINSSAFENLKLKDTVGVYLYASMGLGDPIGGGEAPDAIWHVRMFAPDAGIPEDPATGGAAAAFPGQIALSEKLENGDYRWVIEQGVELGRPSRIVVNVEIKDAAIVSVRIGGAAVPVSRGQIFV